LHIIKDNLEKKLTLALAWLAPLNAIFHHSIAIHQSFFPVLIVSIIQFTFILLSIHSFGRLNSFASLPFPFSIILLSSSLSLILPSKFTIFWHHPKTGGNKMSIILLPAPLVVGRPNWVERRGRATNWASQRRRGGG
jgi:hypothetical protein